MTYVYEFGNLKYKFYFHHHYITKKIHAIVICVEDNEQTSCSRRYECINGNIIWNTFIIEYSVFPLIFSRFKEEYLNDSFKKVAEKYLKLVMFL